MKHARVQREQTSAPPRAGGLFVLIALGTGIGGSSCNSTPVVREQSPDEVSEAEAATRAGDWTLAADCWSRIFLAGGGRDARHCAETARALLELGDARGAHEILKVGLEQHPTDPDLLEIEGHTLCQLGFRRAAETSFEAALAQDPDRTSTLVALGRLRIDLGLERSAVKPLEHALAVSGGTPEILALLARAAHASGQGVTAYEAYAQAFESGPGDPDRLVSAASLWSNVEVRGRYPDAITVCRSWLQRAIDIDPQNTRAYYRLGVLSEELDDVDGAIVAYRRAVELDPAHLEALTNLSILYSKRLDEANTREMVGRALELERSSYRRARLTRLLEPFAQEKRNGKYSGNEGNGGNGEGQSPEGDTAEPGADD